jgi:inner membrane protein involved in colicin E2 resistance
MTTLAYRAALLFLILILFHAVLGVVEGTAEQEARYRQERMGELSDNLASIGLHVLGPLLAGGVAIFIMQRVAKNQVNRSRNWVVGFVVALGTFGIIYLL